MTISQAYKQNPALLGSAKMTALYESLAGIPFEERVVKPAISGISITSDGFVIAGGNFIGAVDELEDNLYRMCEHFGTDSSEVEELMKNTTDWRNY